MNPITDIVYNYDYAKRLYRGSGSFEDAWNRLLGLGDSFEKIYEECIDIILASIERYSGFSWEEQLVDDLPIYMVVEKPSLANPLSLAMDEDLESMLEDLIYQLAHRNMSVGFPTPAMQEQCLRLVTDHIIEDLNVRSFGPRDWDLRKKTVKEYLRR